MKTKKEELEAELTRLNALRKQVKEKLKALPLLDVGKWYRLQSNNLVFTTSELSRCHVSGYGFSHGGKLWSDEYPDFLVQEFKEATKKEVEQALIEEANRRGHTYGEYDYNTEENELCGINNGRLESVFCDGHWEQPSDKFAELKEAHRNGAVIQWNNCGVWVTTDYPEWNNRHEYRIKPEETPTLKDHDIAIIERLHDTLLDNHGYDLNSKLLSDSRELCKRIQCIIEKGAN